MAALPHLPSLSYVRLLTDTTRPLCPAGRSRSWRQDGRGIQAVAAGSRVCARPGSGSAGGNSITECSAKPQGRSRNKRRSLGARNASPSPYPSPCTQSSCTADFSCDLGSQGETATHVQNGLLRSKPPLPARASASTSSSARSASATSASSLPDAPAPRPLPRTWSNPTGEVLREVVPGLTWTAERPFIWNGIDVGGRMGVVRLRDGSLWVHSPVAADADLQKALQGLGEVRHVVSPNYEHCKYAQQWIEAYPNATAYGCPGQREKEPQIAYSSEVGAGDMAPADWGNEFEITFFDCEHNPFTGKPFFNEVLFFHRPSRSLFVTDLFWNYPGGKDAKGGDVPYGTKAWKFGMDVVYLPFYRSLMVTDRKRFEERVRRVLEWEWETLIPCHGSVVQGALGKQLMEKHLLS